MPTYSELIKNHTKITLTSKKTGTTAVLLNTKDTESDHTVGAVEAGFPLKESVDDSLDSFTFIVHKCQSKELYKPFDVVTLTIDDGTPVVYEMCVLFDHAQMVSRIAKTYKHTITAIESTKILEKTKIFNLNLTNTNDTLLDQVKKAIVNAEPIISYGELAFPIDIIIQAQCRFKLSDELTALLTDIPGEDFNFGNTDLRTVLDGILAAVNARIVVTNISFSNNDIANITLGYRSLTDIQSVIPSWIKSEQGEIINDELENNGQDYAGSIVARGYNSLMQNPVTYVDVFKSNSTTVDDTNASAFLPFPLSDQGLNSFKVKVDIYGTITVEAAGHSSTMTVYVFGLWVDITDCFVPSEQYELLSATDQQDKIPYNIGSSIIGSGGTREELLFWAKGKMDGLLLQKAKSQYGEDGLKAKLEATNAYAVAGSGNISGIYGDYYNFPYLISYYPLADTAVKLTKPGVYDKDEILMGISDNQSEKTLNVQRHGRRLESLIKRTGNDECYIDVNAAYFSKLLPIMSKISLPKDNANYSDSDYIVYKRECAIFDNYVKCRYYLSKNFNAVQQLAGVNREKRLFDIPLESDECPLMVKKYMVFGFTAPTTTSTTDYIIRSALGTLLGENIGRQYTYTEDSETKTAYTGGKINYVLFNTKAKLNNESNLYELLPGEEEVFVLPCLTYGQAKTMNFIARPLDNYSVGYGRDGYTFSIFGDAGWMITYNRYVSNATGIAGECQQFNMKLAFDSITLLHPNDSAEYKNVVKKFPVGTETDFVAATTTVNYYYYKDRTQKPLFCNMIECVPAKADYGNLFIGSAFCRDNNLVKDNGTGLQGLRLVASTTKYINTASEYISDGYSLTDSDITAWFKFENNALKCINNFSSETDIKSWAIVNANNEVYLAANGNLKDIYITISDYPA